MAFQTSIIQFTGRAGNLVGRKHIDGRHIVSIYQPHIRNPRTTAQTFHRAKMAVATILASRLGHVIDAAKPFCGEDHYAHNRLVGRIKDWATSFRCIGIFPEELPLVKEPDFEAQFSTLTLTKESDRATLHAELIPEQAARLFRSTAAVIAYNQTKNQWQSISLRHEGLPDTQLTLPGDWAADDIQLAGYLLFSLHPEADGCETPQVSQVCCVYNMPATPVSQFPIYPSTPPRRRTATPIAHSANFFDPKTACLRDGSELTPSYLQSNSVFASPKQGTNHPFATLPTDPNHPVSTSEPLISPTVTAHLAPAFPFLRPIPPD